jgi:hypothetical protein
VIIDYITLNLIEGFEYPSSALLRGLELGIGMVGFEECGVDI